MTAGRLAALGLLAVATLAAVASWALGAPDLLDTLLRRAPVYGAALAWVSVAPVPLALALLATWRTPWPWVGGAAVHLVVTTGAVVRLRNLVPWPTWVALAGCVALGVASIVLVLAEAQDRRSTTTST